MYRKTWLEVDLDKITNNCRKLKKHSGKDIIAVVKANAYGCGDKYVVKSAIKAGAKMVAVSSLDEALILRNEGFDIDILILGYVDPEEASVLIKYHIQTTLVSKEWLMNVLKEDHEGLMVHLKYDTGMNRIGIKNKEELKECYDLCIRNHINVTGMFTHFALSDNPNREMTNKQYAKFKEGYEYLNTNLKWVHCSNSDATIDYDTPICNAVRIGIAMYGYSTYDCNLEPALSLYTRVAHVKHVNKGETIGYGATYTCDKDEVIATLPIGYADGFIRKNQGRSLYIAGKKCEIVGRVCMDQVMVKASDDIKVGDLAEIFGPHISLESMAKDLDTIVYEIITNLTERLTRVYVKGGQEYREVNNRLNNSFNK